ncbi:MAG TPA: hypothetical protein VLG67_00690 [Candidatus Saccharimonadales bacterium]|nr:hypothetical protein [Candidatus Saccharimonadales bacterium]
MNSYKIGVFGSAEGDLEKIIPKAHQLGEALGGKNVTILTGASIGLPYEVALTAHNLGTEIWGYSQFTNYKDQLEKLRNNCDPTIFHKLFYVPKDYEFASNYNVTRKYRNVSSTANCDAGIIISGRWGTMNEFTNLHDMGKVVGVLTGTGGIADELPSLMKKINKPSKAKVIFNDDPEKLVDEVLKTLSSRT